MHDKYISKIWKNQNKIQIVTYIDGPFISNKNLGKKEQQKDLRDRVYNCMVERSKNSNIEYVQYIKKKLRIEKFNKQQECPSKNN